MNGLEIKEKIDKNNKLIESLLTPNQFTLNNTVKDLLKENDELQSNVPMYLKKVIVFIAIREKNNGKRIR